MCVDRIVDMVECRQNRPTTINLRVIAIDLRDDQENGRYNETKGKCRYQWICVEINLVQCSRARYGVENKLWEMLQLADEGADCLGEVSAVRGVPDDGKSHRRWSMVVASKHYYGN